LKKSEDEASTHLAMRVNDQDEDLVAILDRSVA
jgi:hypothetical protein